MNLSETSLVLLVNHEEWAARSFESILKPRGYAVLKAYTGRQGLELAAKIRPDIVMVEHRLPDMMSEDVCEALQQLATIRPSTPVMAFTTGTMERRDRLRQLRAGAWDVLSPPFDPEEVLARIERYVAAKRDTDAALEESHVDPLTGCYNLHGLMRRVTELAADAARSGRGLGCVIVGPVPPPSAGGGAGTEARPRDLAQPPMHPDRTRALAQMMTGTTRVSDAVGRIAENEFVVVAPGIDRKGAHRLAERLLEALAERSKEEELLQSIRLKAGIYASGTDQKVAAEEVLSQATAAFRRARAEGNGAAIYASDAE